MKKICAIFLGLAGLIGVSSSATASDLAQFWRDKANQLNDNTDKKAARQAALNGTDEVLKAAARAAQSAIERAQIACQPEADINELCQKAFTTADAQQATFEATSRSSSRTKDDIQAKANALVASQIQQFRRELAAKNVKNSDIDAQMAAIQRDLDAQLGELMKPSTSATSRETITRVPPSGATQPTRPSGSGLPSEAFRLPPGSPGAPRDVQQPGAVGKRNTTGFVLPKSRPPVGRTGTGQSSRNQ
jgi:hypothetical protein